VRVPSVSLAHWNRGSSVKMELILYHEQRQQRNHLKQHAPPWARMKELCPFVESRGGVDRRSLGLGVEVVRDSGFAGVGLEGRKKVIHHTCTIVSLRSSACRFHRLSSPYLSQHPPPPSSSSSPCFSYFGAKSFSDNSILGGEVGGGGSGIAE
jgi:hypothetical protein